MFEKELALGAAGARRIEEVSTWHAVAVRPRKGLSVSGKRWRAPTFAPSTSRRIPTQPSGREAIEELEGRLSETAKTVLGIAIAAGIVLMVLIRRR